MQEELFSIGKWRIVRESTPLPDGRVKTSVRVERPDVAHIIAITSPGKILLLREFRPYYGTYIWMIPSGKLEKNEDIAVGAQRELREETGYRAQKLRHLWTVNHTESVISSNYVFLAEDLVKDPLPQDEGELIEVHEFPLEEALNKVLTSEKVHTPSAYALLRYLKEYGS